jgi:hypothetical protein
MSSSTPKKYEKKSIHNIFAFSPLQERTYDSCGVMRALPGAKEGLELWLSSTARSNPFHGAKERAVLVLLHTVPVRS